MFILLYIRLYIIYGYIYSIEDQTLFQAQDTLELPPEFHIVIYTTAFKFVMNDLHHKINITDKLKDKMPLTYMWTLFS